MATFVVEASFRNLLCLPGHDLLHEDLVAASHPMILKPGCGIVAECLVNRTPILYTSNSDFAEYQELVKGLREYADYGFIPSQDFLRGDWGDCSKALRGREFH